MAQDGNSVPKRASRLRADKHAAIMTGGREVFAREGYQRASIDAVAAASGVSTRTIYKHFANKSALFAAVVADSSTQVAEEVTTLIDQCIAEVTGAEDLEPALIALANEWVTGDIDTSAHRELTSQVRAEAGHLGPEIITAWWQAGPGRAQAAFASALARWAEDELLSVTHPERAATQFSELVTARPGPPTASFPAEERQAWIADGVRVFLQGHR